MAGKILLQRQVMGESGFSQGLLIGDLVFAVLGVVERAPGSSERVCCGGRPEGEREALIRPRHRMVAHRTGCESQLIAGLIVYWLFSFLDNIFSGKRDIFG